MPWQETCPVRERMKFMLAYSAGEASMAELCRSYGISRPTGYKWVQRYLEFEGDLEALVDLPRAPHHHPWTTGPVMVDLIIRARRQQPTWSRSEPDTSLTVEPSDITDGSFPETDDIPDNVAPEALPFRIGGAAASPTPATQGLFWWLATVTMRDGR